MTDSSLTTSSPSQEKAGEDEYLIKWRTRNWEHINQIREYFGIGDVSVNFTSSLTIRNDDPRFPKLLEGAQKGFYFMSRKTNVSKS